MRVYDDTIAIVLRQDSAITGFACVGIAHEYF